MGESFRLDPYLKERCSISGHDSFLSSSEYILNKMRRMQAKLEVSCFNKFGLDLPLKPTSKQEELNSESLSA